MLTSGLDRLDVAQADDRDPRRHVTILQARTGAIEGFFPDIHAVASTNVVRVGSHAGMADADAIQTLQVDDGFSGKGIHSDCFLRCEVLLPTCGAEAMP